MLLIVAAGVAVTLSRLSQRQPPRHEATKDSPRKNDEDLVVEEQ
jgi:hypothetical protein